MFARQHPPLGIVVLPGAAHIPRLHGGNEAGEDRSMGKSSGHPLLLGQHAVYPFEVPWRAFGEQALHVVT